ncbi:DEAD/DEAH box helicase family protein [Thermomonospora cellulosilytica]|uniref:Type I restriction enzyme R subunit n=1 Tax=Thermomonospora cellulosilytica TaxID=1411118 RepID=A0A7W3MSM6_9ACTN|nr:DEAD/DEAH box helicase family protein [Thermomonospora cellulosilytica]MBA9001159.1 type I restriction enzyme R subunit [Thermomonospora cellulosilytica]
MQAEWAELHAEAVQAERLAVADPRTSCFYARRCLEQAVNWLYEADSTLRLPHRNDLAAKIAEPTMARLVGSMIRTKMDLIRRQGNIAVHGSGQVREGDAVRVVAELFHVMYWIARRYTRDKANLPADGLAFDRALIPRPQPAAVRRQLQAELQAKAEEFEQQQGELLDARRKATELDAEIKRLREEIKAAKEANAAVADTHDYNEADTRRLLIDLLLKEAGWRLDKPEDREYPVTGLPETASPSGNGFVDYVLWDDDGKPLGVVEAKRTGREATAGLHQAKLYADCLEAKFGQRPVIFATNGYEIHLWDDVNDPPRQVQGFYTKDELRLMVQRRTTRRPLSSDEINGKIVERYYQVRAITRVAEALEQERRRHALLVMATGTGKTRTVIALVDLLMRAGWVKRVLFLADRKALVRQATAAFKTHLESVPTINLLEDREDPSARVYVSTYQTMMGMIDTFDGDVRRFGVGHFDLVVVDEAHRTIYAKYGALLDYFDAPLVGLTATPRDEIDRNTYRRFQLNEGEPTDVYDLDEAIEDGYLVKPVLMSVTLTFMQRGVRYDELSEEEKEAWEAAEWDEEGNVPDEVSADELNKYLFNADTVDKMLEVLMEQGIKVGDRDIGKTIIFARNVKHAEFIAERFNVAYPQYKGRFAQVITAQQNYAQSLIDDFSQPEKMPQIAISVDMLDTGIDVPEVVNLVFAKPVYSRTKFWQMLGRGTRLRPDLFGPDQDKTHFLIFDLCRNAEFFNAGLKAAEGAVARSISEKIFRARLDVLRALDAQSPPPPLPDDIPDGTAGPGDLRWALADRLRLQVLGMNPDNFLVRPHRRQVQTYSNPESWQRLTESVVAEIAEHLAALPSANDEGDGVEAKQFDLLALRLQLTVLTGDPAFDGLRARVQEIASGLLDKTAIPAVAEQLELLEALAGEEWWQDVTAPMLEAMRRRVRGLVRHVDRRRRKAVYLDVQDTLGDLSVLELQGMGVMGDRSRFEARVRTYLRSHEDNLAVQKLRRNRQITTADLTELEKVFLESAFGTEEDIERVRAEHDGHFGLFLRSLTGLDRQAAVEAFARFMEGRKLSSQQMDFLNLLIDSLSRNGIVKVDDLYEAPFTHRAPGGPEAIFPEADVEVLITVLDEVRSTAVPPESAAG